MVPVFCWPSALVVRSRATAAGFLNCLKPGMSVAIPDADDARRYHEFIRKDNDVYYGSSFYAKNALLGPALCVEPLSEDCAVATVYALRKSINRFLRGE